IVLVVSLDHVPWRPPPPDVWDVAGVVQLLEDARYFGLVFTVSCTERTLTAFPSLSDFVLGEGHRLKTGESFDPARQEPPEEEIRQIDVSSGTPASVLFGQVKQLRDLGWTL
ncbi:MAG: hypothetical protein ABUL49_00840, partial [bacterium]